MITKYRQASRLPRLRPWALYCALLAGSGLGWGGNSLHAQGEQSPYFTQRTSLAVPFSVTTGANDFSPVAVQVFVSYDRGKNWQQYSQHRPDEGEFPFRTKRDGEYWFATRTIDSQKRALPAGNLVPQLRIVVDTTRPALELSADAPTANEVKLTWLLRDEWLQPNSFQLEYQAASIGEQGEWSQVPFEYVGKVQGDSIAGHTEWSPDSSVRVINLRAKIKDKAGNEAVVYRQVFLPRSPRQPEPLAAVQNAPQPLEKTEPPAPQMFPPVAAQPPATRTPLATAPDQGQWNSLSQEQKSTAPSTDAMANLPNSMMAHPRDVRWPNNSAGPSSLSGEQFANDLRSPGNSSSGLPAHSPVNTGPGRLASSDISSGLNGANVGSGTNGGLPAGPGYPLDALPFNSNPAPPSPAAENHPPQPSGSTPPYGATQPAPAASPRATEDWLDREVPRRTRSNRFNLDYEVASVAPENLSGVELWGTSDGGRSWVKWGNDNDRMSPFEVEVSSEAIYGFRIVIVARNGVSSPPPQPGDSADIWIQVDSTPPTVRLTQAAYGQAERAGQLDIRWEAADAALADRPITLSFSDRPEGPFTTIAAGLPNDGQFWWPFDPRSPRQIYLRVEAKDAAGNVGVYNLPEPINAQGLIPRGRIRSLETPEDPASSQAFRAKNFR